MPELDQKQRMRLATHVAELIHAGELRSAADLTGKAVQRFSAPSLRGRLPAEFRLEADQVEMLALQGARLDEIAAMAGVSRKTLWRKFADSDTLSAAYKRGVAGVQVSARRRLIFEGVVCGDVRALLALIGENVVQATEVPGAEIPEGEADEARRESVALELERGLKVWRGVFGRRTADGEELENVG